MTQSESHPIRNGIIATVAGGLILAALGYAWAPVRIGFGYLWGFVVAVGQWLVSTHAVPGWLLLLSVCGTGAFIVSKIVAFARGTSTKAPHVSYVSDTLFGALWHWSWSGGQIRQLWSSCLSCQGELVHLNERDNYLMSVPHAKFYCEHCREVRVDIEGGGHEYAYSAVEREIRRRLRVAQERTRSGVGSEHLVQADARKAARRLTQALGLK